MNNGRLEGRTMVITGAARGIGLAIARAGRVAGARVIAADLAVPAREASTDLDGVDFRQLDVTDTAAARRLLTQLVEDHGPLDILVNNAGVLLTTPLERCTPDDWGRVMRVNLEAVFTLIQAALPCMASPAAIVNIASTSAFVTAHGQSVYEASKAGVVSLTRSLAVELAPRRVRVNAVAPGLIDTPMTRELFGDAAHMAARVKAMVPLGRAGTPDDVADAVVFLASPDAAYITGETLVVDGGWLLR
jgi:NAD(P)-dependent dehydrogenase (short-subunit alcohol dehydrogenase family)